MSLLISKCLDNSALMSALSYVKYCHKPCNFQYLHGFWLLHGMQVVSGSSPLGSIKFLNLYQDFFNCYFLIT